MQMRLQQLDKGWWAVLFILILGGWLQISGYNNGVVIKDRDEAPFYIEMLYRLEGGEALKKQFLIGYPPPIFFLYEAAHRLTADPTKSLLTPHLVQTVSLLKLWAVGANLTTALLLVLSGRLLVGWRVGLAAGFLWVMLPVVIMRTVIGMTEAWQVCSITASAYFMLLALARGKRWAAVASTVAAVIALLFKYANFPVLGLGIAVTLWQLWQTRRSPRAWLITLVIQIFVIGIGGLIVLQGVTVDNAVLVQEGRETTRFLSSQVWRYLIDLPTIAYIWKSAAGQIGLRPYDVSLALSVFMAGAALILMPVTWKRMGLFLILGLASLHLILIGGYMVFAEGVQRYTTPPTALWVLVVVTSFAWIMQWMAAKGWRRSSQWLFGIGLIVWAVPAFRSSAMDTLRNTSAHPLADYVRWTDVTLPNDGALLIAFEDWWLFDRTYWDYHSERATVQGTMVDASRQEWLDKGIVYATVKQPILEAMSATEAGQRDLESMTRLKTFMPSGWIEETISAYYLPPLQVPAEGPATFDNGITLIGCRLTDASEDTTRRLRAQCLWQAAAAPAQSWKLYLHIVPLETRVPLAQADGTVTLASRPPQTWTDPEEVLVGPAYTIDIPEGTEITTVRVLIGLYDEASGGRALQNGQDYVELPMPSDVVCRLNALSSCDE